MKKHKALKLTGIVIGAVLLLLAAVVGLTCLRLSRAVSNVEPVDDRGLFYSMDYSGDYDNALMRLPVTLIQSFGCSAFCTENEDGEVLTARSYDLPHLDENGDPTGLNVIFRLEPEDGYASLNIADAAWFTAVGIPYTAGALDNGGESRLFLAFLPYICMDGMNEKGLTVSILALDTKDGETAVSQNVQGRESVAITELLRLILDHCADVEDAAQLAASYNLTSILGCDYHLFVTDAQGTSAVMEWRYNTMYLTYQDAVTNFYVAFDDAEDCYVNGELKDPFVKADGLARGYRYGYGHGYGRFETIVKMLNAHITDPETLSTTVSEAQAMYTLAAVSQVYDGTDLTSNTQYSVIYNASDLTAEVCVMRDYTQTYVFSLEG